MSRIIPQDPSEAAIEEMIVAVRDLASGHPNKGGMWTIIEHSDAWLYGLPWDLAGPALEIVKRATAAEDMNTSRSRISGYLPGFNFEVTLFVSAAVGALAVANAAIALNEALKAEEVPKDSLIYMAERYRGMQWAELKQYSSTDRMSKTASEHARNLVKNVASAQLGDDIVEFGAPLDGTAIARAYADLLLAELEPAQAAGMYSNVEYYLSNYAVTSHRKLMHEAKLATGATQPALSPTNPARSSGPQLGS